MKQKYFQKSNQDFQRILTNGKKFWTRNFMFFYLPSEEFTLGISVPKKLGKAVKRNKLKRQIKAILSEIEKELIQQKVEIILITKENWINLVFSEKKKTLLKDIELLIAKVKHGK